MSREYAITIQPGHIARHAPRNAGDETGTHAGQTRRQRRLNRLPVMGTGVYSEHLRM